MPTATLEGRTVQVDAEGYLTDRSEWDEDLARSLASRIGIELTADHLVVLRFLRADFEVTGESATLRRAASGTGMSVQQLFTLFPQKPAKKMAYVAGLPKPRGCV